MPSLVSINSIGLKSKRSHSPIEHKKLVEFSTQVQVFSRSPHRRVTMVHKDHKSGAVTPVMLPVSVQLDKNACQYYKNQIHKDFIWLYWILQRLKFRLVKIWFGLVWLGLSSFLVRLIPNLQTVTFLLCWSFISVKECNTDIFNFCRLHEILIAKN